LKDFSTDANIRSELHEFDEQWRTQKISEGGSKFRNNRVTSQINYRGSAEGTTILAGFLGGPGACPRFPHEFKEIFIN